MSNTLTRIAAGTAALLFLAAATNVALQAQTSGGVAAISTTCGAGTIELCGVEPIMSCDWSVKIGFFISPGGYPIPNFDIDRTCQKVGERPIYKDKYPTQSCTGSTSTTGGNDEPLAPEECI